ncbi:MAG: AMP-binding protein [Balneolales bacterium]
MNLYSHIYHAANSAWQADAFRLPGGKVWTHEKLHDLASRIAAVLAGAGVKPGDRITVQVEKSIENVALYLASLRLGAIYMPLNTSYTDSELDFFLGDAEPRVLVCDPDRAETLEPLQHRHGIQALFTLGGDGSGTLSDALTNEKRFEPIIDRSPDDVAVILYTSGTTGRSKGAMITHANLYTNAVALRQTWGWSADDVLLHALPIYHIHGLFVALHCALLEPTPVIFLPRFEVQAVLDELVHATVYMGVPTHYVRLLTDEKLNAERCAGMRLFTSGSAPLLQETFEAFHHRTGHQILERYGMTEAGMIASNPLDGERVAGTVGYPLPDIQVRVYSSRGEPVKTGEVGVLEVRGPNIFTGYWRRPDKTREEFRDGWFITGDLVQQDHTGRIRIVGRQKDMIISGGLNIYPREIEAEMDELEGIVESAVIGVPHEDFGEGVLAVVVATNDWPGEEDTREKLRKRLAGFKIPKRIIRVERLPRNAMGKVQKKKLREYYMDVLTA